MRIAPGDIVQVNSGAWYQTDIWLGVDRVMLRGWPLKEPERTFRIPLVAVVARVIRP